MSRITMLFVLMLAMIIPAVAQSVQEIERERTTPNCCGGWDRERIYTRTEGDRSIIRAIGGGISRVAPDIIWAGRDILINDRTMDSYDKDSDNRRAEIEHSNRTTVTTEEIRTGGDIQQQRDAACADAIGRAQERGHMNARCRWVNGEMVIEVPQPRPVATATTKTTTTVTTTGPVTTTPPKIHQVK